MNSLNYANTRLDWLMAHNNWVIYLQHSALKSLHDWNICRYKRQQTLVYPKNITTDEQKKDYKSFIQNLIEGGD
jgi:hypothetical protein